MMTETSALISTGQAARLIGVSEQSIRQWAASGRLPATVTPLGRLFDRAAVAALAAERERATIVIP